MNLGRYRLVAELARGGMGVIHLAETCGPGGFEKLVVVKELKRELADDPVYVGMFLDEARLAAQLSHRHIVQTHEVGCEGGRYFMALELLDGASLAQIQTKLGLRALPTNLGLRVLAAVLGALDHAHHVTDSGGRALGVVHRDVSPQNVFLTYDGNVKLIDFGVAKSRDRRRHGVTRVGVIKGSVPYMSPDHVDGSAIDRRADVFAVGVLLREMLTERRLWGDVDDMTMLRRLIARDLPGFPASRDVPTPLRAIVEKAMAPHRADRFPTAAAMRDAIEAYLAVADPRGSLDELGVLLDRSMKDERAAFCEIVRRGRAGADGAAPQIWLPSCELKTRFSGPPVLPVLAPPLPVRARSRSRLRILGAGALVAALLALTTTVALSHPGSAPVRAARTPRTVEESVRVPSTKRLELQSPEPEVEPEAAAPTYATAVQPAATNVRDMVLREVVPPNPYGFED